MTTGRLNVVSAIVLLLVANNTITSESVLTKTALKGNHRVLYVVSDNTNCYSLSLADTDSECGTLSYYVQNVSYYFTNNTVMNFTPGQHQLKLPSGGQSVVNMTGISNFTMIGQGDVVYNESEEGAPLPNSTILCDSNDENKPRNGILFYKADGIHIENLTIENCGANFTVRGPDHFTLVSALTFRESYNVNLKQVRIDKSLGFGLDADRIFGSFQVSRSAFMRCRAYPLHYNKNLGGNARFWYSSHKRIDNQTAQNTTLIIDHSWFMYGHLINKDRYRGFYYASGLIIFIYIPSVDVQIDNVTVKHNIGTHGGNVAIQVTDYHENTSKITINNSVIADGSAIRGGGLQFWVQVDHHPHPQKITAESKIHYIIRINNTHFTNNSAGESGGGIYIGHYETNITDAVVRHISFYGCTFSYNSVHYTPSLTRSYSGAAVQVLRHNIDDFVSRSVPQFSIDFERCVVVNNSLKDVTNEGGILDFVSTQNVIVKDSNFSFNEGTAISLRQSNIKFLGNIAFMGNWGTHGGALKFCELSKMYLPSFGVYIDFINNSANISGGAIYVSQQLCLETAPPCFFQVIRHKNSPVKSITTRLRFRNNTANLAGDTVYGGQVDHCYLYYSGYDNYSTYLSQRVFNKVFDLSDQPKSLSPVSSPPYGACFYDTSSDNGPIVCGNIGYPSLVYAGQSFTLHVVAVGQQNGTSPVSASFFQLKSLNGRSEDTRVVINTQISNEEPETQPHYASLNCTIYSNQSSITFSLTLQQASQAELRYVHYKPNNLTVNLGECPWGFELTKAPPYTCVCDNLLDNYSIPCNINTQQITRWGFYWLGCDRYQDQSHTNQTDSTVMGANIKCEGVRLAKRCVLDYCSTSRTNISAFMLDNQCTEGREGIMCGRCKQNYSLSVGTSRCLPYCSDYMVYVLVGAWIASGIVLILFLILCNFTISEGTINGLFFYAHMIHKNANLFFPGSTGTSNTNLFRLFIAWLNLDLGFEVCFYKKMTQYQKVWLQFGFLFYVWMLEYFIIVLSRKYIFFTRLVGRNVVKVLATLGLVSFPLMFNTALSCLEFTYIHHSDRQKASVAWQPDGNIGYLKGKHIPLFILGTAFCILALLYTLVLLFIQCLQKQPNVLCFRWIDRQRPFFEAHTGPCHVQYRFWPGCLFFTRITLFTLCSLLIDKNNFNLYIIITACVVTQIIAFLFPNRIYKRWPLNVLESLFILNLGVVSGLLATFCRTNSIDSQPKFNYQPYYFVYPSVTLTMVLFAGILLYHCTKQLNSYHWFQRWKSFIVNNKRVKHLRFKHFRVKKESHSEEETEPFLRQDECTPPVTRFNNYREVLIED